jgi:hypothetical protein
MNINRIFFIAFGLLLCGLSVYLWMQTNLTISLRGGKGFIQIAGTSRFLLGMAPFFAGLAMFRQSQNPEKRNDAAAICLFMLGVLSIILVILFAPRVYY